MSDDRAIADAFIPTTHLLATLRVRGQALRAVNRTPSLRERLVAGLPTSYRISTSARAA